MWSPEAKGSLLKLFWEMWRDRVRYSLAWTVRHEITHPPSLEGWEVWMWAPTSKRAGKTRQTVECISQRKMLVLLSSCCVSDFLRTQWEESLSETPEALKSSPSFDFLGPLQGWPAQTFLSAGPWHQRGLSELNWLAPLSKAPSLSLAESLDEKKTDLLTPLP